MTDLEKLEEVFMELNIDYDVDEMNDQKFITISDEGEECTTIVTRFKFNDLGEYQYFSII
jgi:hypothetical protein